MQVTGMCSSKNVVEIECFYYSDIFSTDGLFFEDV